MSVEWSSMESPAWHLVYPQSHDEDDVEEGIELQPLAQDALDGPEETPVFTKAYAANAGIVLATTATQAIVNRFLNNNDIRSGDSANSYALMLDMIFANFSNKMVKGNWSEVDSIAKQSLVLGSYIAQAAAFDAWAYLIPRADNSQPIPLGQATLVAAITAMGYVTAMSSAAILGKHTFTKGERVVNAANGPPNTNPRRFASCALLAVSAAGAATANRLLVDPTSALGVVLNMATSEIVNKIFKTGQGTESETANKIKLLSFYLLSGVVADAIVGSVIPSPFPFTSPWRYIGGTSVGAGLSFIKVSAKALLDHGRTPDAKPAKGVPKEAPPVSKWRMAIAGISAIAIPICTIAANHLSFVNKSPTLSLAVKMVQHNANGLAVGELFKLSTGTVARTAISLVPAALSIGAELAANAIDPKNAGYSVTGVAVGIAASYMGMTLSGWLLGNANDDI